jgi:hypothetical protein
MVAAAAATSLQIKISRCLTQPAVPPFSLIPLQLRRAYMGAGHAGSLSSRHAILFESYELRQPRS